jgi:hypothetical protein
MYRFLCFLPWVRGVRGPREAPLSYPWAFPGPPRASRRPPGNKTNQSNKPKNLKELTARWRLGNVNCDLYLLFGRVPAELGPETRSNGPNEKWCRTHPKLSPEINYKAVSCPCSGRTNENGHGCTKNQPGRPTLRPNSEVSPSTWTPTVWPKWSPHLGLPVRGTKWSTRPMKI